MAKTRLTQRTTAKEQGLIKPQDITTPKWRNVTDDFKAKKSYLPRQQRGDRPSAFRSMAPKPRSRKS